MIQPLKVNKILSIPLIFAIIFLTGCATKEYHKKSSLTAPYGGDAMSIAAPLDLSWPLQGRVAERFGLVKDRVRSNGMTIESGSEEDVRAAADGRVALVDQNLKGYGKTLILEHGGNVSTVYAKNSQILVVPGQKVRRGEVIAKAGKKNGGASSELYFEVRRNLKAENPELHLKNF